MQPLTEQHTNYKALYEQQSAANKELQLTIASLTHQLHQLQKMIFGSKTERFMLATAADTAASAQLSLALEADTITQCKIMDATKVSYIRTKTELTTNTPKAHPGRMKLPEHLRREVILLQPDRDVTGLRKIGDEVSEVLDYTPGELYVKQYIRPKYVQPLTELTNTVITASLPGRLLDKCMAGEGLLSQIIVDKYMDHLPLHRQLQRFERAGITIAQSTINDWVKAVLTHLTALYEVHKKKVLDSGYLHADETPIKVLDDAKKGTTHQGYYWVYHNSHEKLVLFDYRSGRGREGPDDILKDFKGYWQTDGYIAYDDFDKREGITLMHCMAHARRKFSDALQSDKNRAEHALSLLQQLYAIERRIKEEQLSAEAAVQLRQQQAVPLLSTMKQWMTGEYAKVLPKSPVGQAIGYCLPRWEKLEVKCLYDQCPAANRQQWGRECHPSCCSRQKKLPVCRLSSGSAKGSNDLFLVCYLQATSHQSIQLAQRCIATHASLYD
ncbi:IS66 family transposase [Ilyomonas limi]|uniref:IS66 family transposase n=1 Tax=Ilyomonas limi TaxID=2575867 RepID=A0A4U3L7K9_9BACT|nr:IS66 family transposase [Ilyomonas limi]TKK70374.1 IS66 family transposase [Ilyomonas limi]